MRPLDSLFRFLCLILLAFGFAVIAEGQTPIGQLVSGATAGNAVVPVQVNSAGAVSVTLGTSPTASLVGVVDANGNRLATTPSGPVTPANADGVVVSYEPLTSGGISVAMTATTSTVVGVLSGLAGSYYYLTSCTVSNGSTTVSTDVLLQDGSGGTTMWVFPAAAASTASTGGGGVTHNFGDHPLKAVLTAGHGIYAANVTTGSSTKIFCNGFTSTNSY